MNAKHFIDVNNEKRNLLTFENEKYYSDLLVYLRLQLSLSEQKTEEILMEILDHLIEGQSEGKTAKSIFGDQPKEYADEIIALIPKEEKRDTGKFIFGIALNLLGWILLTRGIVQAVISPFQEIDSNLYLIKTSIIFGLIAVTSSFGVWFIFRTIKHSLFAENNTKVSNYLKAGLYGALSVGAVMAASYFVPDSGPSIPFEWYISALAGAAALFLSRLLK